MKNKVSLVLIILIIFIIGMIIGYLLNNNNIEKIISKNINSVVSIIGESDLENYKKDPIGFINNESNNKRGSGFIIDKNGLIITNKHVLNCSDNCSNKNFIITTNENKTYNYKVAYIDKYNDIALLKITPGLEYNGKIIFSYINSFSNDYNLGETVISIGNSYGELGISINKGIISGKNRNLDELNLKGLIQTNLNLTKGNSGGPLFNLKGEIIGINTAKLNNFDNIGFAIPVNQNFIEEIIKKVGL